jgi:hypothetical protein
MATSSIRIVRPAAARCVVATALFVVAALAGGGCGTTTVDPRSGEKLIRDYAGRIAGATVKSVKCPSGVKPVGDASFDCKVVLIDNSTHAERTGTITVHITPDGKKVQFGPQDVHVH